MRDSAVNLGALLLAIVVAVAIAATLIVAHRGGNRRGWIAAGILALVLLGAGTADVLRADPRETHVTTVASGVVIAVLGTLGMVRGTRRARPWLHWAVSVAAALVLLLGGLLFGAAFVSRVLPF